ncbi:MAG TPA: hypothetical protein EYQ46_09045, partial [Myxococcales bacterium]|nr:hypothetical protein [Myxococcales bacterium]
MRSISPVRFRSTWLAMTGQARRRISFAEPPATGRPTKSLGASALAATALAGTGGPIGTSIATPGSAETQHVGLVEWIEGVELASIMSEESGEQALVDRYDQLGRIAAKLHNQAVSWQIPSDFQRHAFDADGFMGDAPFWGPFWGLPELSNAEREIIVDVRQAIHRILSDYGKGQGTYSMIHADLHPHNILANGGRLY